MGFEFDIQGDSWAGFGVERTRVVQSLASQATVIEAVPGHKIRVLAAIWTIEENDRAIDIQSDSNNIGALEMRSGVPIVWAYQPLGHLETRPSESLAAVDAEAQSTTLRGVVVWVPIPS